MSLTDLDLYYVKAVASLHSCDHLINGEPSLLQVNLEEAIKNKTGIVKDFGSLITSITNRPLEELKATTLSIEESKTASSSDSELVELDLFNEDLMCIICNGMDVGARNRLLECSDCHALYHQECHRPPVTSFDPDGTWTCQSCKDAAKRMKKATPGSSPLHSPSPTTIKPITKQSPPHSQRASNPPNTTSGYKAQTTRPSFTVSVPATANFTTSKMSTKTVPSTSNVKTTSVTPNINIISADKRLQIMKKKAAKLHEKRKQLPR